MPLISNEKNIAKQIVDSIASNQYIVEVTIKDMEKVGEVWKFQDI